MLPMNMVLFEHAVEETVESLVEWFHDHFGSKKDLNSVTARQHRSPICRNCYHNLNDQRMVVRSDNSMKQALLDGIIPAKNCHCSKTVRAKSVPLSARVLV